MYVTANQATTAIRLARKHVSSASVARLQNCLFRNHYKDETMTIKIKSIVPVQVGNEWRIRARYITDDPTPEREIFYGAGAGYTMHQAQVYASNLRRDTLRHGVIY